MSDNKAATTASWITVVINTLLCILKLLAGIIGRSSAMIADGIHTLSDILATYVVIIGLKISSKEADDQHPYGHEKFEPVCAKIISFILFGTGLLIGYEGVRALVTGDIEKPGTIALAAAAISILIKEIMYWYTVIIAKRIKSLSMEADAWHHRSDAFSSIGTFVGILGARMGIRELDPIAAIIVCFFILKVGLQFYIKATNQLVDLAADKATIDDINVLAMKISGVKNINDVKTRIFGNKIYVDMCISVDESLTVKEGHDIAEAVHDCIEDKIDNIKHCMIHIEPDTQ